MHEPASSPQSELPQRELLSLPIQLHLVDNDRYPCSWTLDQARQMMADINEVFAPAAIHFQAQVRRCRVATVSLEAAFDYPERDHPRGTRKPTSLLLMAVENFEPNTLNIFLLDACRELGTNLRVPGLLFGNVALFSVYTRDNFLRSHCIRMARLLDLPLDKGAPDPYLMNFDNQGLELREHEIELLRANLNRWLEKRRNQPKIPPAGSQPEIVWPVQAHLVSNSKYPCSWGSARLELYFRALNSVLAQARVRLEPHIRQTQVSDTALETAFQQGETRQPPENCEGLRALSQPGQINLFFLDFCPVLNTQRISSGEIFRDHGIGLLSLWDHKLRNQALCFLRIVRVSYDKDAPEPCLMNYKNNGFQLRRSEIEQLREAADRWQPTPAAISADSSAPPPAPEPDGLDQLNQLVGRQELKAELRRLNNFLKIEAMRRRRQGETNLEALVVNLLLSGNPGTGKSTAAQILGQILKGLGALSEGHLVEMDRSSPCSSDAYHQAVDRALGGVLLINDAEHLLQATSGPIGRAVGGILLNRLRQDRGKFALVLGGQAKSLEEFVTANGFEGFFRHHFTLSDFTAEELSQLFLRQAALKGMTLNAEAEHKLQQLMRTVEKQKGAKFGNLKVVQELLEKAIEHQAERLSQQAEVSDDDLFSLRPEDIPARQAGLWNTARSEEGATRLSEPPENDTLEAVLAELDGLIGLPKVKAKVHQLVNFFKVEKMRQSRTPISMHMVFSGAPGTGKTTVARLMGRLLKALELLGRGQLVETDRAGLVGSYLGQTAPKTNAIIDQAIHGVLFIDEAYSLVTRADDCYGMEAVNTLLKRMEDSFDHLSVICAGYTEDMEYFLRSNPGLQSRMQHNLIFEDYTREELQQIFLGLASKRGFQLGPGAEERVAQQLQLVPPSQQSMFGNGRGVRNFFDHCLERQAARLAHGQPESGELHTLLVDDILLHSWRPERAVQVGGTRISEPPPGESLETVLAEVDRLIGLSKVKSKIHQLVDFFKIEKMRQSHTRIAMHMVFAGAPGTGKTTVARLMGRLFRALKMLSRGQLVETDRSGLVAGYHGHTAPRTNAMVDLAMHGVLFIDEAYSLSNQEDDAFGMEAVNTLLKRMEDSYDRLSVICAGYTDDMETFLNSNPGLQSRLQHRLDFEDYTKLELLEIFQLLAQSRGFQLGPEASDRALEQLQLIPAAEQSIFGNGRGVRNFFDHCLERQAARLAQGQPDQDDLHTLVAEDVLLHSWRPEKRQARLGFRQNG
ncbi:MAG: AAA family ATPase [Vulcanimicrobiota bacterium]